MACILPTIFNMILNGCIGAIMFHSKDTVPIWGGPKSVGGDVIVMIAIMSMCTWIFGGAFTTRDMRIGAPWFGKLAPLNLYSDSFRQHKLFRWFLKHEDIVKKQNRWQDYFIKLFCAALRAVPFTAIVFVLFVVPTLAMLTIISNAGGTEMWWVYAIIFKIFFSGELALLISPGAGFLAMASYVPEEEEEVAALNSDWASESFEGDLNLNGNEEDSLLE